MVEHIVNPFALDIGITHERYTELLSAEQDAIRFRNLIRNKLENFETISYQELKFLATLFDIDVKDPLSKKEREADQNG